MTPSENTFILEDQLHPPTEEGRLRRYRNGEIQSAKDPFSGKFITCTENFLSQFISRFVLGSGFKCPEGFYLSFPL